MSETTDSFAELFTQAQDALLTPRQCRMLELRYGFTGEDPHTLKEIGEHFGITRERVRQILDKAHRRIRSTGWRQWKRGNTEDPCAQLLIHLNEVVRADEEELISRIVGFINEELPYLPFHTHALPLVTILLSGKKTAKHRQKEVRRFVRKIKRAERGKIRLQRQQEKLDELLSFVVWPDEIRSVTKSDIARVRRRRDVSMNGEGYAGTYYSQKLGRSVQYESEMEMEFLLKLEDAVNVVFYQEQPFEIPYGEDDDRSYFPDVLIVFDNGHGIVVEIKPVFKMALQRNLTKWSALRKFCARKGLGLLVTDGRYAIQQIQRHEINSDFRNEILAALQLGPMSWQQYKKLKERYQVTRNEFVALILNHRLRWELSPFKLSLS